MLIQLFKNTVIFFLIDKNFIYSIFSIVFIDDSNSVQTQHSHISLNNAAQGKIYNVFPFPHFPLIMIFAFNMLHIRTLHKVI